MCFVSRFFIAELCAFFCGRKHLEPWNYGNNSTGCVGESSDIGRARECKHDLDLDREDSPVIPTALLAISGAPFLATSVFYAFIWIKMKDSKRLLQSLEIAALNKHIREVKHLGTQQCGEHCGLICFLLRHLTY